LDLLVDLPAGSLAPTRFRNGPGRDSVKRGYSMLLNSASGPQIGLPGRILAGLLPVKYRNRPSGQPRAGRRGDVGAFPVAVRQPISGPEAPLPNIV
jgi:hypothetical protein